MLFLNNNFKADKLTLIAFPLQICLRKVGNILHLTTHILNSSPLDTARSFVRDRIDTAPFPCHTTPPCLNSYIGAGSRDHTGQRDTLVITR